MKDKFIVYFIKRVNTLPYMQKDIEFIVTTPRTLKHLGLPKYTGFIRGIPVALFPDGGAPSFLVKRWDTGKHEDWLEDYKLDPDPAWNLMVAINQLRRLRAKTTKAEL